MEIIKYLCTDLLKAILRFLQGEELPLALTNTRLLQVARSVHEDGMLSAQRLSAYLSSGALTKFVLDHDMVEVNKKLMELTVKHGCLHSMKVLRAQDPPCPWDWRTCGYAAGGGRLDVLQWARSQDPPWCPWDEWTCRCAARGGHLHVLQWARSQDPPCRGKRCSCLVSLSSLTCTCT